MTDRNPKPKKGWIREWVETILIALVLALIIRTFVIQVFYIPSSSMEPTLNIGDRIIVNKFIYNFRKPERFEIMVFKDPNPKPGEVRRDIIKRIIGLPGDIIEERLGVMFVNGSKLDERHPMNPDRRDFGPYKVPQDGYFMMGDNRPVSLDSRFWEQNYLPRKHIVGYAFLRIWPILRVGLISERLL